MQILRETRPRRLVIDNGARYPSLVVAIVTGRSEAGIEDRQV